MCFEIFTRNLSIYNFLGGREFLLECAGKAGIEGAAEFLRDPSNGVNEVFLFGTQVDYKVQ